MPKIISLSEVTGAKITRTIDCHHNYAGIEEHFGEEVIVHRKGAIQARKDKSNYTGFNGNPSYIVEGLGKQKVFALVPWCRACDEQKTSQQSFYRRDGK